MRRSMVIAAGLLLLASPALAGPNPNASLAMHTVVTDDFLYCTGTPVCPDGMVCGEIDNSALEGEIPGGATGYCYIAFLTYNYGTASGVEFMVTGWPTVRGAPAVPVMSYCPTASTVFGDPWDDGGAPPQGAGMGFGVDLDNPSGAATPDGVFCFAFGVFNMYDIQSYWPLTLSYGPSSYTTNPGTGNKITGAAPDYLLDMVQVSHEHGCTIGGVHSEDIGDYADCTFAQRTEQATWSAVKALYR